MIDKKYIFYLCIMFMGFDSSAKSIFIGDSLTLSQAKGAKEQDVLEYYYLNRSGLMNEAFYDWLAFVQRMPVSSPDFVIVSLGANDGMAASAGHRYSQKIRRFISTLPGSQYYLGLTSGHEKHADRKRTGEYPPDYFRNIRNGRLHRI
ncbi:TPA: hypothetical protein ACRRW7_003610 [Morganella morganii]